MPKDLKPHTLITSTGSDVVGSIINLEVNGFEPDNMYCVS